MKQLYPFAVLKQTRGNQITEFTEFGYTLNGVEYQDTQSGNINFSLGYYQDHIIDYVAERMKELPFARRQDTNPAVDELNDLLGQIAPEYQSVSYALSGSDALETAIRAAHLYHIDSPNRKYIISYDNSYHGSTYITSKLTGNSVFDKLGDMDIVHIIPDYDDISVLEAKLEELGAENVLAVIKEPFTWQQKLARQSDKYYTQLQEICNNSNIVLISDEVGTGMCKTGEWFAYQRLPYVPDIICAGKSVTSGYFPLSFSMFNGKLTRKLSKSQFLCGWTHSPSMAGVYSAIATINSIKEQKLQNRAYEIETWMKTAFSEMDVAESDAVGVFGFITPKNASAVMAKMQEYGVYSDPDPWNHITFCFPLNIDKEWFDGVMEVVKRSVDECK
jgi:adenosylmethionine-8-amino-7-oxononanoate aminotransferase